MLYAFAGSTHEDKSMYGADSLTGQPLFDCLSLLVMLLCDIAGKVKIKMAMIALIAVVISLFSYSSLAYYTTVGKATNVVTSGSIQFIIHETTDQGKEFPKEGVYIVPGDVVSKKVTIESDCNHPFYLRVKMVYGVDSQELTAEDCFKLNINEEYWELHDGWYYYKGIVNPGETTPNVPAIAPGIPF